MTQLYSSWRTCWSAESIERLAEPLRLIELDALVVVRVLPEVLSDQAGAVRTFVHLFDGDERTLLVIGGHAHEEE